MYSAYKSKESLGASVAKKGEFSESMLHGSKIWPVRKEKEMALQRAELRMVRWMCGVKLKVRVSNKELRETGNSGHNVATTAKQVTKG